MPKTPGITSEEKWAIQKAVADRKIKFTDRQAVVNIGLLFGLSYSEIGRIGGWNRTTAYFHWQQARKKLVKHGYLERKKHTAVPAPDPDLPKIEIPKVFSAHMLEEALKPKSKFFDKTLVESFNAHRAKAGLPRLKSEKECYEERFKGYIDALAKRKIFGISKDEVRGILISKLLKVLTKKPVVKKSKNALLKTCLKNCWIDLYRKQSRSVEDPVDNWTDFEQMKEKERTTGRKPRGVGSD